MIIEYIVTELKETLATNCTKKIKELILNCDLKPGDKIKGDYLKNVLNCGLSPIREALTRLLATGVIELVDNSGFKLSTITQEMIVDFYKSYAKLEKVLFSESILKNDESWESSVVTSLHQLAKIETSNTKPSYANWSIYNDKFHDALVSGAGLSDLENAYKNLSFKKHWLHNCVYGTSVHREITVSHREHSKIAELALSGDGDTAIKLLYKHTSNSCDILLRSFKR